MGFVPQRCEDGSDEKRSEKAEGHCAQRINEVGLYRNVDLFAFQEIPEGTFTHNKIPLLSCL